MRVFWSQRCGAKRRDGQPCGQWAMTGGYVCRMHGGMTPRVRAAAERRFAEALATRALMERMAARLDLAAWETERRAAG
jgi:hypothetical protein